MKNYELRDLSVLLAAILSDTTTDMQLKFNMECSHFINFLGSQFFSIVRSRPTPSSNTARSKSIMSRLVKSVILCGWMHWLQNKSKVHLEENGIAAV